MHFSTRGEYGLRAAVNLARCYPIKKTLKEISREEKISKKYLERLIGELKNSGIVGSIKGKKGGYFLANEPKEIKVGEVIECTEGPILVKCYGTKCKMVAKCSSSYVWIKLGEQIKKTLYAIKLSDLIK
jgi:Rrf2 family transcriptional regulator, cysteine metabolism repressor